MQRKEAEGLRALACSLHKGQGPVLSGWVRGRPQRRLPSAAAVATERSSKKPSSTVILNACRVANGLCWFKKKKKKGKHKSKDMEKAQESPGAPIHTGWAQGFGGRWCRQGRSIQQMVYITGDWQLRVSSQFYCCFGPRGRIRGKEERWEGHGDGHAGSEAAGWVRSNEPPSFFVVFQI